MSLQDVKLQYEYRSDTSNIIDAFYVPCFAQNEARMRSVPE